MQNILNAFKFHFFPKYTYWYGNRKILSRYVGLPSFLCNAHTQHGLSFNKSYDVWLDINPYWLQLVDNESEKYDYAKWFTKSKILSPPYFLFFDMEAYKKSDGCNKEKYGAIYFPVHSTGSATASQDWDDTISCLDQLPIILKPILICLYHLDYTKAIADKFNQKGYDVVTNGAMVNNDFCKKFYRNINSASVVLSNKIGSYTFHSIYLKKKFYLIDIFFEQKTPVISIDRRELVKDVKTIETKFSKDLAREIFGADFEKDYDWGGAERLLSQVVSSRDVGVQELRKLLILSTILLPVTYPIYILRKGFFYLQKKL